MAVVILVCFLFYCQVLLKKNLTLPLPLQIHICSLKSYTGTYDLKGGGTRYPSVIYGGEKEKIIVMVFLFKMGRGKVDRKGLF